MRYGLKLKLFTGATLVGTCFALLLSMLRLFTDAHSQHVNLHSNISLLRYAYQLPWQVHHDLLGIIFISYLLVYVTTALLYPFLFVQHRALQRLVVRNISARRETLIVLGNMIAKRDSDTGKHNYRVTLYAIHLAKALRIPETLMHDLIVGSFLHDIGKIAISDRILFKPGSLDEMETKIMRTHVTHGLDIIRHCSFLREAQVVVGGHHERYDGTGYPKQLVGALIPIIARIFTIADVFDAITSRRPYKPAFSLDKSIRLMALDSGKAFDPEYLKVFLTLAPALHENYATAPEELLARELGKLVQISLQAWI